MAPNTANPRADQERQLIQFKDPLWGAAQLADVPLFGRFTEAERAGVYALGRLVKLKAKANAVIEGEPSRGMYVVLSGRVSVYKTDPESGKLSRLTMLAEGAHFGELSLFDQTPRSATVVAETLCFLFQLDEGVFNAYLSAAAPELQLRFYKACAEDLAARFRQLNGDFINAQQQLWRYALRR